MPPEEEERFRSLVENLEERHFIYIHDPGGVFTYVSPSVERMLGYTPQEFCTHYTRYLTDNPGNQEVIRRTELSIKGLKQSPYMVEIYHKNGSTRWLEVSESPIFNDARDVTAVHGIATDITDRKRAEEDLRQSEEFIRSILDSVDEAFIAVDRDFRIISANRAYCQQTGTLLETVLGRHCYEISHRTDRPCYEDGEDCAVKKVFETGQSRVALHKHEDANGGMLYVETRAFPIKDTAGSVTAAIETITNITERYLLEEEQLKTQKLEAIGTLAGGIAHDFNNMLQGVFGYISMARLTLDDRTKALLMLEQAEKALSMSVNLTSQLLTFSKGGKPAKKKLDLHPLIENSVKFALSGSRSYYRLSAGKDLWQAEVDGGQVGQVIQNIVLNANEAMPEGGIIRVAAENIELRKGENRLLPEGGKFVRIAVKDSGVGIPGQYLSRIFDPYFTTKQKGSGLGLATSYSIIRNHGGAIEARSKPDKGSTFIIWLPAAGPAEAEPHVQSESFTVPKKGRVLVMDDEELVRNVAGELIRALGHEVECASDGKEATEKFRRSVESGRPFDVVILDLTIKGGMGGDQAIRLIREIDPDVPAVVSSGYSDDPVISDFRSFGFNAFLNKPYRVDALRESLNSLLGLK